MGIVIDIPFSQLRGRNWSEMEKDELQNVFSEACDELLKPHGLRVRTTFIRNPMCDGEKWFIVTHFVDETDRKSALLQEMSFFYIDESNMEDKISWNPSRPVGVKTAGPTTTFTFSYGRLSKIKDKLLFLRVDFGSPNIQLESRTARRGTTVQPLMTT